MFTIERVKIFCQLPPELPAQIVPRMEGWWARSDSNRGPRDSLEPRRFRREWTISSPPNLRRLVGAGRSSLSLSATLSAQVVSAPSGGVPPAWLRVAISRASSAALLRVP